jgi:hypothetical protein
MLPATSLSIFSSQCSSSVKSYHSFIPKVIPSLHNNGLDLFGLLCYYHPSGRYPGCIISGRNKTLLLRQYSPSSLQLGESAYFWLMQTKTSSACSIADATCAYKKKRSKESFWDTRLQCTSGHFLNVQPYFVSSILQRFCYTFYYELISPII